MLDMPGSLFLSYFPTNWITCYVMSQHMHRFTSNLKPRNAQVTDWVVPANYTASGFGFKFQLNYRLNIELLYTNFWRSQNNGLGSTFNIGIKYVSP